MSTDEEISTVPRVPPTEATTASAPTSATSAPVKSEHVGLVHKIKDVITGEHHHGHDHSHHSAPGPQSTVENAGPLGEKQELGSTDPAAQVGYGTATGLAAVQGGPVAGAPPRSL